MSTLAASPGRRSWSRAAARERRPAAAADNESAARFSGECDPVTDDRPLAAASLPKQIRREPHLLLSGSSEDAQRGAEIDRHPSGPKSSALESYERDLEVDVPAECRQASLNRDFRDRPYHPLSRRIRRGCASAPSIHAWSPATVARSASV